MAGAQNNDDNGSPKRQRREGAGSSSSSSLSPSLVEALKELGDLSARVLSGLHAVTVRESLECALKSLELSGPQWQELVDWSQRGLGDFGENLSDEAVLDALNTNDDFNCVLFNLFVNEPAQAVIIARRDNPVYISLRDEFVDPIPHALLEYAAFRAAMARAEKITFLYEGKTYGEALASEAAGAVAAGAGVAAAMAGAFVYADDFDGSASESGYDAESDSGSDSER